MIQYEIWIWKKATKGQMGSSQKVRSSRRVSLVCLSSPNGCCRWDTSLQPGRRHTAAVTVAMNCCTTSCCWHRNVRNDRPMRMAWEWLLPGKHHSAATNAEGHHLHFWVANVGMAVGALESGDGMGCRQTVPRNLPMEMMRLIAEFG